MSFKPGEIVVPYNGVENSYGVPLHNLDRLEVVHDMANGPIDVELCKSLHRPYTGLNPSDTPVNGVLCRVLQGRAQSKGLFRIHEGYYSDRYSSNPKEIRKGTVIWLSNRVLRRVGPEYKRTEATKNKNATKQLTTPSSSTRRILALRGAASRR